MLNTWTYITNGRQWIKNPYAVLDRGLKTKGPTFFEPIPVIGRTLFTGDPALIEEIVNNDILHAGRAISILDKALGERSLITLDGKDHKDRKKLLLPLMQEKNVSRFDEATVRMTRRMIKDQREGQPFSAYALVREVSLRVIVELLFGKDDKEESLVQSANDLVKAFQSTLPLVIPALQIDLGPYSPWGRALRRRRAIEETILQRLESTARHDCELPSLLDRVKAFRFEGGVIPTKEIAAEAMALLAFGHDTAAATLAWGFEHIYRERGFVTSLNSSQLSQTDFETQLDAALNESMRLCPVVAHLSRKASSETSVGKYAIKENQMVAPSSYLAGRNPELWTDPDKFKPRRFLEKPAPRFSFFPYGLTDRTCYGKPLAQRQMFLIMSTAMREFPLQLATLQPDEPARGTVLVVPKNGTLLRRLPQATHRPSTKTPASNPQPPSVNL